MNCGDENISKSPHHLHPHFALCLTFTQYVPSLERAGSAGCLPPEPLWSTLWRTR
jgi:hypothetical protein